MPRTKKVVEAETTTETTTAVEETKKAKKSTKKTEVTGTPHEEHYHVKMWFIQPLLGSQCSDPELRKTYIASKAPDAATMEEELMSTSVENVAAKGVTVFLRRTKTGLPCVKCHTILGFYKAQMTAARRQDGNVCKNISAHIQKIEGGSIVKPTYINFKFPEEVIKHTTEEDFAKNGFGNSDVVVFPKEGRFEKHMLKVLDRPLRAKTAQGDIVSIAASEIAPEGTMMEYDLTVLIKDLTPGIFETLRRGQVFGTGQWRTSQAYGAFVTEVTDEEGNIVFNTTKEVIGCLSTDPEFNEKFWEHVDDNRL